MTQSELIPRGKIRTLDYMSLTSLQLCAQSSESKFSCSVVSRENLGFYALKVSGVLVPRIYQP